MTVQYEIRDRVAAVTIDRAPVNALNLETRQELADRLRAALSAAEVEAIVLWGGPRIFSAGADIEEFAAGCDGPAFYTEPTLPTIVATVDASTKPVVAAIAGACLGGGFELALACHARLCATSARFGLPEVKLGLIPGAGGTQRLPRLIGIEQALHLILSGSTIDANRAGSMGIAQCVEGDLLTAACAHARFLAQQPLGRVSDLPARLAAEEGAKDYFAAQRAALKRALPAPLACIDAVEFALSHTVSAGSRREFELFQDVRQTPESEALRYAFFSDRAAGKQRAAAAARPTGRVAIIGSGTMGTGIAICCLDAGLETILTDACRDALGRAHARIEEHYSQLVRKARLDPAVAVDRVHLLSVTDRYDSLGDRDLVIEAVYEDMAVKQAVFRELDRVLPPSAVLASNTSTLDLNEIASVTNRPGAVVGLHFFSPANIMRLLEVVRGRATSGATLATALRFAKTIGKTAVVAAVCDGFIGNRMFEEYLRQAYFLVDQGVLPWRIDAVLERWGMAMGPFAVMDLAGNDIGWAIRKRRALQQPSRPYSTFPDKVCELQRFGRKSGAGYYAYDAGGRRAEDPIITRLAEDHARALGLARNDVPDEEIIERCVLALVNEGGRLLDEDIAERASDLDVVYRNGYGFPGYRGGPLFFADTIGLERVLRSMQTFRAGYAGWFWEPASRLVNAAQRGARLTDS
jgi:3-hydroxyacyl-CoA dehydrogenase